MCFLATCPDGKAVHCASQEADMSVMRILFFLLVCLLLLVCIDILLKLPSIEKRKTSTLAWLRFYSCPPPTVHLILVGTPITIWRYRFSRSPSCPPTCLTQKCFLSHLNPASCKPKARVFEAFKLVREKD